MVDFFRDVDLPAGPISMLKLAELFGVSEQTANDWCKRQSNPLKSRKVGKKRFTTREHVLAFTESDAEPEPKPSYDQQVEALVTRILLRHGFKLGATA